MFHDFYGLTGRPFQLTPDPDFWFESGTHRKALSYLGYGMSQGEGFIVITGEVGAGKSTLVAHLMQRIDPEQLTVGQVVTSKLDGEELVHVAAQSFGLDIAGHDKAAALGAIEAFLQEEARAGRRCLLVVDESQNLDITALEELRMLSNFQLGSHPLLQVLLLGQPEFRQVLASHAGLEQLRQRVIASHHLAAMQPAEIEGYVLHRLACVGWDGKPAFDGPLWNALHEATGGIPRKINQVMNRLLLLGAVEQRSEIDEPMLQAVLDEMEGDAQAGEADAAPSELQEPAGETATADSDDADPFASPAPAPVAAPDPRLLEAMLAERDARLNDQIAELQQAVVEISDQQREVIDAQVPADWFDRLAALEERLNDQERSVRRVLTLMIEWLEGEQDAAARRAA